MSMPTIPNITPEIILKRNEVLNLLLTSIALEEIGLSHIINAEGQKIQKIVKEQSLSLNDALALNNSVERMLRNVIKTEMILQFRLEDIIKMEQMHDDDHDHHHHHDDIPDTPDIPDLPCFKE
ncbi:hypothetical protein ABER61_16990 [Brevibacillus formosus]|uniref:Uncharacterized protein n=1 Tax=Brevibacillus formosus TaxID=54913 RepID=A0A837KNW6_9BACL|nr:hypothetical protein [Brevibacillus formosus]KLH99328.1 hypothetical protein AA984_12540 [Brevibacillus formosus]MED1956735.1 hypothetical protein [Brevibacillus formosus]PSJ93031.1 hypothetical protein C7R91_22205 [Brevibacillus formosus]GED57126.1 hypothetical protein BFO01nite_12580 [Brevibacillus formosus]